MGYEPPKPMWDVKDVVVPFFLVHGGHDLAKLGANGGVVPFPPVQERIVVRRGCVEVIWATQRHDAGIVGDEGFGYAVGA